MSSDWLLNQEHRSDFETRGSKVTFNYKPDQCVPYNAMYLAICANEKNKKYYWEFTCSGDCSVGIAKKESFGDGYKLKGAFFNGNLTDGSSLLVGEFGDFSHNNKIGMILDLAENELKVYFVQNDRPLGLAFLHSAPYARDLHPTISFNSPGSVKIDEKEISNIENLLVRSDYRTRTIDGKYKLTEFVEKANGRSFPAYELTLKGDGKNNDVINLRIHVINSISCVLTKMGKDLEGDIYAAGSMSTTLMAGDPERMLHEACLSAAIHSLKRIKFNDTLDEVTIISQEATLHFKRFLPQKSAHQTSTLLK